MGSGPEPFALDDGRGRGGHAGDDVRLADGRVEIVGDDRREPVSRQLGGKRFRLGTGPAEDEDLADRPHAGMGAHKVSAQRARPHQRHRACVRAGQIVGGQGGGGGGAAAGDFAAIHHGNGRARCIVDQQIARLDGGQALRGIVGLEDHRLETGELPGPGRHEQENGLRARDRGDGGRASGSRRENPRAAPRQCRGRARGAPLHQPQRSSRAAVLDGNHGVATGVRASCAHARSGRAPARCGPPCAALRHLPCANQAATQPTKMPTKMPQKNSDPQRHLDGGEGLVAVNGIEARRRPTAGWPRQSPRRQPRWEGRWPS